MAVGGEIRKVLVLRAGGSRSSRSFARSDAAASTCTSAGVRTMPSRCARATCRRSTSCRRTIPRTTHGSARSGRCAPASDSISSSRRTTRRSCRCRRIATSSKVRAALPAVERRVRDLLRQGRDARLRAGARRSCQRQLRLVLPRATDGDPGRLVSARAQAARRRSRSRTSSASASSIASCDRATCRARSSTSPARASSRTGVLSRHGRRRRDARVRRARAARVPAPGVSTSAAAAAPTPIA